MKKVLLGLLAAMTIVFVSCENETTTDKSPTFQNLNSEITSKDTPPDINVSFTLGTNKRPVQSSMVVIDSYGRVCQYQICFFYDDGSNYGCASYTCNGSTYMTEWQGTPFTPNPRATQWTVSSGGSVMYWQTTWSSGC